MSDTNPILLVTREAVQVPTLMLIPPEGKENVVYVLWYGESANIEEGAQMPFPLAMEFCDMRWVRIPLEFRVVFVGQMKDWQKEWDQKIFQGVSHDITWSDDMWVAWIVSSCIGLMHGDGTRPASYLTPIGMLNTQEGHLVTPQPFAKPKIYDEELEYLRASTPSTILAPE